MLIKTISTYLLAGGYESQFHFPILVAVMSGGFYVHLIAFDTVFRRWPLMDVSLTTTSAG